MSGIVTIEEYDDEQAIANCRVSYVEIMAFATTTLALHAFPSNVALEAELARYVDWNNSSSNYQYFKRNHFVRGPSVETAFTPAEAAFVESVSNRVAALTRRRYGREMRPISTLLSQFGLFRAVMSLQRRVDRPLTVFEVGPGNGYLGAMLFEARVNYIGFDNAQALYLWQNRLLAECAGADFYEWVADEPPTGTAPRIQHLPWWRYLDLRHDCPIKADIFISNTNLGEMNYGALQYTTRIARKILEGSRSPVFLFTNIGDPKQNSMATVEAELAAAGFSKVCGNLLHAYVPKDTPFSENIAYLDDRIPLFNPDNAPQRYLARDILMLDSGNLPSDIDFLHFVGTFSLPD